MGDWVLDSLVGFLQSPRWTHPLNNFVDEKCVVFDPGEENKFSYTDIHKQYSNLVESLLEQFMDDIGMSSQQFIQTWEKCSGSCGFEKNLTQQIVAADDFLCFKALMVQRNIDLEKEAWKLVEEQQRAHHFQEPPPSYGMVLHTDEESMLQQALELSKKEFDLKREVEEEELRHLIAMAEVQWTTERQQQCVQVPTDVCNMPACVLNTSIPPIITNTLLAVPAGVLNTSIPPTIANTLLAVSKPGSPSPTLTHVELSEEGSCTPTVPGVITALTDTAHSTVQEASHTLQALTDTAHSTVQEASHTLQPHAQAIEVSLTIQRPEPIISLVGPPSCRDLSGAEAAARWIESAREELSSPYDHKSLHKESPELHMRQQRDHLLQANKAQREKELKAFVSNSSPIAAEMHKVPPPHSIFSRLRGGKQKDQKLGRTGVLCSAIASKLKKNNQS